MSTTATAAAVAVQGILGFAGTGGYSRPWCVLLRRLRSAIEWSNVGKTTALLFKGGCAAFFSILWRFSMPAGQEWVVP